MDGWMDGWRPTEPPLTSLDAIHVGKWNNANYSTMSLFPFQGKGRQKTYWLDGRKGLSLPLLSSQVDISDDESSISVRTTDD